MKSLAEIAPILHRTYIACLFATALTFNIPSLYAQSSERQSSSHRPGPVDLKDVVDVVGVGALKSNSVGHLTVDQNKMVFSAGDSKTEIPLRSVLAFNVAHDNVALIRGAKGTIASMAPYGVGQVISAIRPNSDVLTVVYLDDARAVHGSVLILPQGRGDDVTQQFVRFGIIPRDYPKAGPIPMESADKKGLRRDIEMAQGSPSIQVALLTTTEDGIPAAFPIGVYEDLISQLKNSGRFERVWRQGDNRVDPNALTLHVNILDWKKGSARSRNLVPFTGATKLNVEVQLTDATGKVLFNKKVDGAKRTHGENMTVTDDSCKKGQGRTDQTS